MIGNYRATLQLPGSPLRTDWFYMLITVLVKPVVTALAIARITSTLGEPRLHIGRAKTEETSAATVSHPRSTRGFNTIELAFVITIFGILAAIAIPRALTSIRAFRASSDARNIASQLALTKMRAADGFTQARLNCDFTAKSCQLEICTTKGTSACNAFSAEGGPVLLSEGMSFGFGSITTPAGTQTSIQNTAQILFNSRSLPVDNTGAPTGNYGLYLNDQYGNNYAVMVYATGRVSVWRYGNGVWSVL